jgi:AcrR family transcriptional regulator
MGKQTYRNSLRSEALIKEAVVNLLKKKKDFYSITVSDVCKESNLNRGTFYNHYANIGEVASAIEEDLMKGMSELWEDSKKSTSSISDFILVVTSKLKENETTYKQLALYVPNYFYNDMKEKFLGEISLDLRKLDSSTTRFQAWLNILSNGIVSLYLDYFEGKSPLSLDEIGKYSIEIVEALLKNERFSAKDATEKFLPPSKDSAFSV